LAKRKKEEFTISSGNKEHLEILFKHFKLRPVGLSRSDQTNLSFHYYLKIAYP
jgi:hypothetical protein